MTIICQVYDVNFDCKTKNIYNKRRKIMFGNGLFESLGIPDLNCDGEVNSTDVFIYEQILDDDD